VRWCFDDKYKQTPASSGAAIAKGRPGNGEAERSLISSY
jgi:hypothetical protein